MTSSQRKAIPAAVVVDSRNVRGQAEDLFGHGREVSVAGIVDLLAGYGFDVEEVFVGIATRQGSSRQPSNWMQDALQRNASYAARIASDARGHVLEGRLVERSTRDGVKPEEKLVDVLCAIQIARLATEINDRRRSGVLVVLSEDMDLVPAYEFASDLSVKVYVAANSTVDTRNHEGWLLLPEGSMAKAVGQLPGRLRGSMLRRDMAIAMTAPQARVMNFHAGGFNRNSRELFVQHNSGARGVWRGVPSSPHPSRRDTVRLRLAGLHYPDCQFPAYLLEPPTGPSAWPCAEIVSGTVAKWRTPTRVTVKLDGGITKSLDAAPGHLLPGMPVVVHRSMNGTQEAWRLVGSPDTRPVTPGWNDPTCPVVVRVISSASSAGARVRAKILSEGIEVTLQPPSNTRAETGMEFAAVPIDHTATPVGVHVTAIAVSSQLR
jgi:hypothetical protein